MHDQTRLYIADASFSQVRAALERAQEGTTTRLESNIGMNIQDADRYARSLLVGIEQTIELQIDGLWLYVSPRRTA